MIGKIDYTKLIKKTGSKYRLCVVAAKRAEQLIDNQVKLRQGKKPIYESELVDEIGKSPLYVALREIEEGYIEPYIPEEEEAPEVAEFSGLTSDVTIDPYEAEIDAHKILDELEVALQEMQSKLVANEESEAGQQYYNVNAEIFEEAETTESIEELQEKELLEAEEEEKELEEE